MQLNTGKLEFILVSCVYRAVTRAVVVDVKQNNIVPLDSVIQYYQQQINKYSRAMRE